MNNNYPICPYCNMEITYDDFTDDSLNTGSTYEINWQGTCPVCGRHFTWKEIYHYSHLDYFEEEFNNN